MNNNNIQNQNSNTPVNQNPTTNQGNNLNNYQKLKLEEEHVNAIITEFGQTSFDELIKKHTLTELYNLVLEPGSFSSLSIVDQFVVRRQLLVTHFIKPESMPNITEKIKDEILTLLAALKTDENQTNIISWLTQISPDLIIPDNFQVPNYQPRAYELWNVSENIKRIIVEATYNEYLGDVLRLMNLPDDKYQNLSDKIKDLAAKITNCYKSPQSELPAPQELNDGMLEIFNNFGRTPLFIQDMKDEDIFGNLVETFSKIEFAVTIADKIKAKHLPQPLSNEVITNETKSAIIKDIVLK
jgi:hypothetical protein